MPNAQNPANCQFLTKDEYKEIKKFDTNTLLEWANRICMYYWNVPFSCPIKFDGRLKRTIGEFVVVDEYLEAEKQWILVKKFVCLSKRIVILNSSSFVENVLKHELCHWYIYTYVHQEEYTDGCFLFENEINRIQAFSQHDLISGLVSVV